MTSFVDAYLPARILGYGFKGTPKTNTSITASAGGGERRNRNWTQPLRTFSNPEGVRCNEDVFDLLEMFLAFDGPLFSWAFRDPMDFASVRLAAPNIEPYINSTDQLIGIGDDFTSEFQLRKAYRWGTKEKWRDIYHPIVDTVIIAMNALDPAVAPGGPYTWEVSRDTGKVTITPAPAEDVIITAGFLYDIEVRFENDDSLDIVVEAYKQLGFSDLTFLEVRPC